MIKELSQKFSQHKNAEIAHKQSAYLRNLFPFFGIPKPLRATLQKQVFKPIDSTKTLHQMLDDLWRLPEREFQYAACDLAIKHKRLWEEESLAVFEKMIREKSWWDTVDLIASNGVGFLLQNKPELITQMDRWVEDPCLWIRRSALIFQLRWKKETREDLLFRYCLKLKNESDFFIKKAIGWCLREYSKTNQNAVRRFLQEHSLSPLSHREASKYCQPFPLREK